MAFGSSGKLAKVTRIVALITALSSACSSKSERFLELVDKKEKPVATKIIHEGKKSFDAVNAALSQIERKTKLYSDFTERWGRGYLTNQYSVNMEGYYAFLNDILEWRVDFLYLFSSF